MVSPVIGSIDILERNSADDAVSELLDDLAALLDAADLDALEGLAVLTR